MGVVGQRRDVATMTWTEFKAVFNEKYFSVAIRAAKMTEFASLVQGKLSVAEYVRQFDRLAKFSPDVVPSDRSRREKFLRGLNSMVHRDVVITIDEDLTTYAQTIDKALTTELVENQIWRENAGHYLLCPTRF